MKRVVLMLVACVTGILAAASAPAGPAASGPVVRPVQGAARTTYGKFLPLALAGDAEIQNLLGYMFFYGEGVERDLQAAHWWFHQAAEQGNPRARRNLGLLHSRAAPDVPPEYENLREANIWFRLSEQDMTGKRTARLEAGKFDHGLEAAENLIAGDDAQGIGARVYRRLCAGCHGSAGIAAYALAPSFARGERMDRSDRELMSSIVNGKGAMPSWGKSVSAEILSDTLAYIREQLAHRAQAGPDKAGTSTRNDRAAADTLDGGKLFTTYCSGCHGFNGIAYYVNSPSFAIGERMANSDQALLRSIAFGKGAMPSWENMLSELQRTRILSFVRTLQARYQAGIERGLPPAPGLYFRFRPHGETGDEWLGADPRGIPPGR